MLWISVESGQVFEGTLEQFRNSHFPSADRSSIEVYCEGMGWNVEFSELPEPKK